jgi:hypothetical protein
MRDEDQKIKLQDHYDCIVLGYHPAAFLSAGLVARLGLSVLVLPFVPSVSLVEASKGQYLDHESNFILGLGKTNRSEGLTLSCLAKLKVTEPEMNKINFSSSEVQVLTPEFRFVLSSQEEIQAELYREFGKSLAKEMGLATALKITENEHLAYWQGLPSRLNLSKKRKTPSIG